MELIIILTKYVFYILTLSCLAAIGIQLLISIFLALAIPMYNAFRFFELFMPKAKFHLPKDGSKRKIADVAAGFIMLSILDLFRLYAKTTTTKNVNIWIKGFVSFVADPNNIPTATSMIDLFCLITLIIISKLSTDVDADKIWLDKFLPLKLKIW